MKNFNDLMNGVCEDIEVFRKEKEVMTESVEDVITEDFKPSNFAEFKAGQSAIEESARYVNEDKVLEALRDSYNMIADASSEPDLIENLLSNGEPLQYFVENGIDPKKEAAIYKKLSKDIEKAMKASQLGKKL